MGAQQNIVAMQGINKTYEYQDGSSGYGSVLQRETLHATCGSETRSGASRQGGYNSSASEELIVGKTGIMATMVNAQISSKGQ